MSSQCAVDSQRKWNYEPGQPNANGIREEKTDLVRAKKRARENTLVKTNVPCLHIIPLCKTVFRTLNANLFSLTVRIKTLLVLLEVEEGYGSRIENVRRGSFHSNYTRLKKY